MIEYYRENKLLYQLIVLWLIVGAFSGPLVYFIIPSIVFYMMKKEMMEELIIGYFFILIISDSFYPPFAFAKNLKNIYIIQLAIQFLFKTDSFYSSNKLYKLFIPFFIVSVITILLSIDEPFFFTGFQKTISFFFSFLLIPNYVEKLFLEKGHQFFKRFILFCFTMLIVGFVLAFLNPDIAYLSGGRYRGIMGNPNGIGLYSFLLFISFSVLNNFYPNLFTRNECIVIYFSILLSIYLSESRNALVAIGIFYLFRKVFNFNPSLGFIFFIVLMVILEYINANIIQIIVSLNLQSYFRLETIENASGRYVAWNFAWKQIQHNFFIGKGFAYDEYYMQLHFEELSRMGHQGGVHNSFLTFWMDHGLIGLIIYLRSFVLVFIKASKKTKFAFPILFAISFTAFFESWLVGSLSAFAFLGLFILTIIMSPTIVPIKEQQEPTGEILPLVV